MNIGKKYELETANPTQTDVRTPQVVNRMPETKPNCVPPRKYAALAKNPLTQQWLVSYSAVNSKNEHLKRFGRLLTAINYSPEQIVKEPENQDDGRKNGKALKAKVK